MNCLCIDVGSTFVKFFIYDGVSVLVEDKISFPGPCIDDGTVYEIPIKSMDELVDEVLARVKAYTPGKCFISVQMHGYVLRDEKSGFGNYISWKDKTANLEHPRIAEIDFRNNGSSIKKNLPILKLLDRKSEGICEFFTLGSYIAYRLTGVNATHKTDGCASGFFDADKLVPIVELEYLVLPKVTHEVEPIGMYNGMEVYTPFGDHQLSFLGSGAGEEAYLLNIGTATQISTLGEDQKDTSFEKRPYFNAKRLLTVSGLTGGEQLYAGYDIQAFLQEILEAMRKLPAKSKILVGGGGASLIFSELSVFMERYGMECAIAHDNISMEGLKRICNMKTMQVGTMLSEVCFSNFPVILKNSGMDFLIVDNEHGAFDYAFMSSITMVSRLVDMPIIVRLPDNNRRDITKLVDMGVTGFLLPMTNTADDIKKVVEYAKYAPIGKRGISTNRAHTLYNPPAISEYMVTANEKVKVYAQIETKAGVDNVKEILAVTGVDGLFVGPNDLSCDLGCIGNNEPVYEAIKVIAAVAKEQEKPWGIITTSKDLIDVSKENGVNLLSYGSEINMLKDACKKIKRQSRYSKRNFTACYFNFKRKRLDHFRNGSRCSVRRSYPHGQGYNCPIS